MTASKKLTLKKPLSVAQQAKIYQTFGYIPGQAFKDPDKEKRGPSALKKKMLRETVSWLSSKYPTSFNPQNPKPLQIGITKEILSKGDWPHSTKFLKKTLSFYAGSPLYQKALLSNNKRVSLEGKPVQEVTDYQKVIAKEKLRRIREKKSADKEGNSKKRVRSH